MTLFPHPAALALELLHRLRQLLVALSSRLFLITSPILLAFDTAVISLAVSGALQGAEVRAITRAVTPAFDVFVIVLALCAAIVILLALKRPSRDDR